MSVRRGVGVVVLMAVMAAGCADPGSNDASVTPTGETSTVSPPTTSSTSPATATTTAPATPSATELPRTAVGYADALVIAWGMGDTARMTLLAGEDVLSVLADYGTPGGPDWAQISHEAGVGSVAVTYENSADGAQLELLINNAAAANGENDAVIDARLRR